MPLGQLTFTLRLSFFKILSSLTSVFPDLSLFPLEIWQSLLGPSVALRMSLSLWFQVYLSLSYAPYSRGPFSQLGVRVEGDAVGRVGGSDQLQPPGVLSLELWPLRGSARAAAPAHHFARTAGALGEAGLQKWSWTGQEPVEIRRGRASLGERKPPWECLARKGLAGGGMDSLREEAEPESGPKRNRGVA